MQKKLMQQFLTRYETAATRREKALALYNAVTVAVPFDEVHDVLGDQADGFLSFIRTLEDEDSDVSTAVAYEKDAPSEEYLLALYEKLKSLY